MLAVVNNVVNSTLDKIHTATMCLTKCIAYVIVGLVLYYFITRLFEQQPAKNHLYWCTINQDTGRNIRSPFSLDVM